MYQPYELYDVPIIAAPTMTENIPAHIKRMKLELHRWQFAGIGARVDCRDYEQIYAIELCRALRRLGFHAAREMRTPYGRIDVMAWLNIEGEKVARQVFELKIFRHTHDMYQAIGQLLSYQMAYPDAALWLLAQGTVIQYRIRMVLLAHNIQFLRKGAEGWREGMVKKNITASPFILLSE